MSALEEIGVAYDDICINTRQGVQNSPEYLALNPKGKVPLLRFEGRAITESVATLSFLDQQHPEARLLPRSDDPVANIQSLSDLAWCSGTLHPMIRQVRMPMKFTAGGETDGIKADGIAKFTKECKAIAKRLGDGWWYGDIWSIVDVYIYWVYSTAGKGDFPIADYPELTGHAERVRARPSFQRALLRERAAADKEGLHDLPL
jgi:glutathione S-transferase